nr:hypothetical protein [Tanacetum cinerariifolium]
MRGEGCASWDRGKRTWGGRERGWVLFLYGGGAQEWLGKRDDFRRERKLGTSSKNLSKLLESQVSYKTGLGFDSQVFNCQVFEYEELHSHESDNRVPKNPENERYTTGEGYHVVPPPYIRTFLPSKPDLVFTNDPNASESLNHLIKDCDYYEKKLVQKLVWNSAMRVNHHNSVRMTHPYSNRNVVPTAVLTRSQFVSLNAARSVPTAATQSTVKSLWPVKLVVNQAHSPVRRSINQRTTTKNSNFNKKVTNVKVNKGNPQQVLKDKGVIDSGCSRYMNGNISFLLEFEEINEGDVAFRGNPKGDTECVVLSSDFKLPDENHVLLRVPRENNMYNVDLKNLLRGINLMMMQVSKKILMHVKLRRKTISAQQYVLLPLWSTGLQDSQNTDDDVAFDVKENENDVHVSANESDKTNDKKHDEKAKKDDKGKSHVDSLTGAKDLRAEFKEFSFNSSNKVNAVSAPVNAVGPNTTNNTNSFNTASPSINAVSPNFGIAGKSSFVDPSKCPDDLNMPELKYIVYSDDEEDVEKPLLKDPESEDVDVHIYRPRIVSLMYLTSSRPDIMFVVYACERFQVTLKVSHLHVVKRIFRYFKGKLHLGLWSPRASPFNLVTYSDSDYAGVSLDRKSRTGERWNWSYCWWSTINAVRHFITAVSYELMLFGLTKDATVNLMLLDASEGFDQIMDFLNAHTIKYALVVNPTIYVSCIKQFWATATVKKVNDVVQLRTLIDGKKVVVSEAIIRRDLHLDDADRVKCLPNEDIFEELARMGYEKPPPKLTFYKAFFSTQWKFLIHTLVQCLSAKRTAWNEFSYSMASAVIYLATGRKFNFSKYIFDSMIRNVDSPSKFLMYPRFLPVVMDNQVDYMTTYNTRYTSLALTQKVFANMRRVGKGFSGVETPLFASMLVQPRPQAKEEVDIPVSPAQPSITRAPSPPALQDPTSTSHATPLQDQPLIPHASPQQKQPTTPHESFMPLLITLMETYLKKRVKKLEKKQKSKYSGFKRGKIEAIDADEGITLVDVETNEEVVAMGAESQGRLNQEDVSAVEPKVFDDEDVTMKMAQTLIKMKAKKAKLLDGQIAQKLHDEENIDWSAAAKQVQERHLDSIKKYQNLKKKPVSIAQARKNMIIYLKNMSGYKMEYFRGMTYDRVRPIFEREYKKVQTLFKPDKDVEEPKKKRVADETLLQESFKKLRASEVLGSESTQEIPSNDPKEVTEEDVQNMLEIVPVPEFKVEALHVKYPIIDWEIHTEGSRVYWKIIRVGGITEAYKVFEDMLKGFDRKDLVALWNLVKEKFSSAVPSEDKEKALWVELKRLFEPDADDVLWKLQRCMHAPLTWKLYSDCEVHHVSSTRGHDIFMLTEKDYPLSNAVMILMLSEKLQVEEDSEMARDLVMKIFMEANKPKSKSLDTSSK